MTTSQPEEQASQSAAWNAVIVYASMLQALDGLCQIDVELESGQRWMPLNSIPGEPYRFRFSPTTDPLQVQSRSAMLAWKVIPDNALLWLSAWPDVLKTLSLYLTGFRHESGIINAIVSEAIRTSEGKTAPVVSTAPQTILAQETKLPDVATNPECSLSLAPSTQTVEHLTSFDLASSLDSAASDNTPSGAGTEPTVQIEDAAGDLLAVMGFSSHITLVTSVQEMPVSEAPMASDKTVMQPASSGVGAYFYEWLKKCLLEQKIVVNDVGSQVYLVAGHVFVRSPTIFYQFIADNKSAMAEQSCDWRVIQKQFEKLKLHKRQTDGTNVYRCEEKDSGKSFNGYLIPAAKIYGIVKPPVDTSLITIQ